jgi:hypothetical protein
MCGAAILWPRSVELCPAVLGSNSVWCECSTAMLSYQLNILSVFGVLGVYFVLYLLFFGFLYTPTIFPKHATTSWLLFSSLCSLFILFVLEAQFSKFENFHLCTWF